MPDSLKDVLVITFSLILWGQLQSQDHYWWADNVGWDGEAHWSSYIITSPRFMGPNALPVPSLSLGVVDSHSYVSLSGNFHRMTGDRTINPAISAAYALIPNQLSMDVYWVPREFFTMSHAIKTERNTFHTFYDIKSAQGDIYLHTNYQIIRRSQWSAAIRLGYKFATSTRQGLARFTDAPGYYFDGSLSYDLHKKNDFRLTMLGMVGIYVWQTNLPARFQNDAILGGLGLELTHTDWTFHTQWRGYAGYIDNGDKPLIWQNGISYQKDNWQLSLQMMIGFVDRLYDSLELNLRHYF